MEKINAVIEKIAFPLIFIAIIWLLIGPYLLTNFSIYDLTKYGDIGSVFSGITSPIIGLVSAILLYITILKQIESNKQNSYEANFKVMYEAIVLARNNINNYSYKNKNGKEGFEIFAETTRNYIEENNTEHLINSIEKINLTFLEIGRVLYLKNSLNTSVEFRKIVETEIKHIYAYYLSTAHSIMKTWRIDKKINLFSIDRLDFIRKEINEIEKKINLFDKK